MRSVASLAIVCLVSFGLPSASFGGRQNNLLISGQTQDLTFKSAKKQAVIRGIGPFGADDYLISSSSAPFEDIEATGSYNYCVITRNFSVNPYAVSVSRGNPGNSMYYGWAYRDGISENTRELAVFVGSYQTLASVSAGGFDVACFGGDGSGNLNFKLNEEKTITVAGAVTTGATKPQLVIGSILGATSYYEQFMSGRIYGFALFSENASEDNIIRRIADGSDGSFQDTTNANFLCNGADYVDGAWNCTVGGSFLTVYGRIPVSQDVCGDGEITPPETCDDGNTESNDGCSATCTQEDLMAVVNPDFGTISHCSAYSGTWRCSTGPEWEVTGTIPIGGIENPLGFRGAQLDTSNLLTFPSSQYASSSGVFRDAMDKRTFTVCALFSLNGTENRSILDNGYATTAYDAGFALAITNAKISIKQRNTDTTGAPVVAGKIHFACGGRQFNGRNTLFVDNSALTDLSPGSFNTGSISRAPQLGRGGFYSNSFNGFLYEIYYSSLPATPDRMLKFQQDYLSICGNGYVAGTETCDDGNLVNGDGCSSTCQTE